jgi:hypothetical protein
LVWLIDWLIDATGNWSSVWIACIL